MPTFDLHIATPDDFDQILEVYRQSEDFLALGSDPEATLEMVKNDFERCQKDSGVFCSIKIDNKLVGVLDFISAGYQQEAHTAYVELLMIASDYRDQGLGSQVLERLEEMLRAWHIYAVLCDVQINNPGGLHFWQQHGYSIAGGPELQNDQTVVYHLRKNLPALPRPSFGQLWK
jgi:ribosomal protein S18 acetylase RimI-like enzyme